MDVDPGARKASRRGPTLEEDRRLYSSAQGQADSAGQSASSGDAGMVMVAYDAGSSPEASRRKLGKKWMKLARKAYMRSHLPGRVRHAVAEALQEYPDAVVLKLREVVESKVGVDFGGKYGVLFDRALLRGTAKPEKHRRPRKRFSFGSRPPTSQESSSKLV